MRTLAIGARTGTLFFGAYLLLRFDAAEAAPKAAICPRAQCLECAETFVASPSKENPLGEYCIRCRLISSCTPSIKRAPRPGTIMGN
jgi:hypothetical protein